MFPSWEAIRETWPLMAALAALWGRLEVAMSRQRDLSTSNEREISDLRAKSEAQSTVAQSQAVQLGRIEEAIKGLGKTLDRVADQMNRGDRK